MIRGYVTYTTHASDGDYLLEEFYRTRAYLIERTAQHYPCLRTHRRSSGDAHYLDVLTERPDGAGEPAKADHAQLADFIMEVADRNLGHLDWQVATEEEMYLLVDMEVPRACIERAPVATNSVQPADSATSS